MDWDVTLRTLPMKVRFLPVALCFEDFARRLQDEVLEVREADTKSRL